MPPGAAPPGAAAQQGKKGGGKTGMIVGGAVAGLLVVGGLGYAVMAMGGGGDPLPMAKGMLPKDTLMVSRTDQARQNTSLGEKLPEQAMWSSMASRFCGGSNVFSYLVDAEDEFSRRQLATFLSSDKEKEELTLALKCGKEVADSYKIASEYSVGFEGDKDAFFSIRLWKMSLDKLPETTDKIKEGDDADNMQYTHCSIRFKEGKDGKSPKCDDDTLSFAKLKDSDYWVSGELKELERFGEDYSKDGGHDSSNLDTIEQMAGEVSSYEEARVQIVDDDHKMRDPLSKLVGSKLLKAADKDTLEGLSEVGKELAEELEGAKGMAFGQSGVFSLGEDVEYHLVILAKSDTRAEKIAKQYEKFLKDLQKALKEGKDNLDDKDSDDDDDKDDKLSKRARQRKKLREKSEEEQIKAVLAAMEKAEIEHSGELVKITLKLEKSDEVASMVEDLAKEEVERAEIAAEIVEALVEGKAPEKEQLKKLGGSELMDAIDAIEVVTSKCKAACGKCADNEDKCRDFCMSYYSRPASKGCSSEVGEVLECVEEKAEDMKCDEDSGVFLEPSECSEKVSELRECGKKAEKGDED